MSWKHRKELTSSTTAAQAETLLPHSLRNEKVGPFIPKGPPEHLQLIILGARKLSSCLGARAWAWAARHLLSMCEALFSPQPVKQEHVIGTRLLDLLACALKKVMSLSLAALICKVAITIICNVLKIMPCTE